MKKIILAFIIVGLIITGVYIFKPKEEKTLKTIKVAEAILSSRKH